VTFRLDEHSHEIALFHDQVLVAIDLHLGARPLAEQHSVAGLNIGLTTPAAKCKKLSASEAPDPGRHHLGMPGRLHRHTGRIGGSLAGNNPTHRRASDGPSVSAFASYLQSDVGAFINQVE
jgi:hypothetical protein